MFGFLRNLLVCTAAGMSLAVVFLVPGGAVAGAVNGLLVGLLVGLAGWRSQRDELALEPAYPINSEGSPWGSRAQ